MRPSQMGRLQVDDFRLDEPIPYVAVPRGNGGRIAADPLVPEGIAAARAFLAARAFGAWSRGSANEALRAPARRAGRPPFTVYQIRHSFAAGLRRTETDVADIQDLYGHTSPETTMIYAPPEFAKASRRNGTTASERWRQASLDGQRISAGIIPTNGVNLNARRRIAMIDTVAAVTGVPQNFKLGRLETSVSDRMTLLQTVQKTGDPSRGP